MEAGLFVKILGYCIACIGALLNEHVKDGRKSLKTILIFVGLMLAILGEKLSSDASNKQYQSVIDSLSKNLQSVNSNLEISNRLIGNSDQSLRLLDSLQVVGRSLNDSLKVELSVQRNINSQSEYLSRKSDEQINRLTEVSNELNGSLDTPIIRFWIEPIRPNQILRVSLTNYSKYTLRDVSVTYFDSTLYFKKLGDFQPAWYGYDLPIKEGQITKLFKSIAPNSSDTFSIILPSLVVKSGLRKRDNNTPFFEDWMRADYDFIMTWKGKTILRRVSLWGDGGLVWNLKSVMPLQDLKNSILGQVKFYQFGLIKN
jgi:hypothetical protein